MAYGHAHSKNPLEPFHDADLVQLQVYRERRVEELNEAELEDLVRRQRHLLEGAKQFAANVAKARALLNGLEQRLAQIEAATERALQARGLRQLLEHCEEVLRVVRSLSPAEATFLQLAAAPTENSQPKTERERLRELEAQWEEWERYPDDAGPSVSPQPATYRPAPPETGSPAPGMGTLLARPAEPTPPEPSPSVPEATAPPTSTAPAPEPQERGLRTAAIHQDRARSELLDIWEIRERIKKAMDERKAK